MHNTNLGAVINSWENNYPTQISVMHVKNIYLANNYKETASYVELNIIFKHSFLHVLFKCFITNIFHSAWIIFFLGGGWFLYFFLTQIAS